MAIGGLLEPVLRQAGVYIEAALKSPAVTRALAHLSKHKWWYIGGGGAVAAGGTVKKYGDYREANGHKKGKMEGTAERAAHDEEKFRQQHEEHERDRQKWKETDKAKDDLIDELMKD